MILSTYPNRCLETPERLISAGAVRPANHDGSLFFVRSLSHVHHDFTIRVSNQSERCDCPDFQHLNNCSHVIAVRAWIRKVDAGRPT